MQGRGVAVLLLLALSSTAGDSLGIDDQGNSALAKKTVSAFGPHAPQHTRRPCSANSSTSSRSGSGWHVAAWVARRCLRRGARGTQYKDEHEPPTAKLTPAHRAGPHAQRVDDVRRLAGSLCCAIVAWRSVRSCERRNVYNVRNVRNVFNVRNVCQGEELGAVACFSHMRMSHV